MGLFLLNLQLFLRYCHNPGQDGSAKGMNASYAKQEKKQEKEMAKLATRGMSYMKPGVRLVRREMEKQQRGMERMQERSPSTSVLEKVAEAATSEERTTWTMHDSSQLVTTCSSTT